jgi:hypothetical protein
LALLSLYVHLKKAAISSTGHSEYLSIALMANIIQITILVLIIYHCGRTTGQSFYYDHSCFVVCAITLASVVLVNKLVKLLLKPSQTYPPYP